MVHNYRYKECDLKLGVSHVTMTENKMNRPTRTKYVMSKSIIGC